MCSKDASSYWTFSGIGALNPDGAFPLTPAVPGLPVAGAAAGDPEGLVRGSGGGGWAGGSRLEAPILKQNLIENKAK